MTVSSLWKALDNAGSGRCVGAEDIMDPSHAKKRANPWTYQQVAASTKPPALAVDLSIWICEGLTSEALKSNHVNPALHLVYTRILKLLNMGIKVVAVIEGKRRLRRKTQENNTFRKRRSGSAFWTICQACERLLDLMGVPAVRAKAEGEALCALLNQRGIVDGVISNDGDCLLFGAKVVYTKFSIERMTQSSVMRYESTSLKGLVETSSKQKESETPKATCRPINLSRHDLISFAVLTGSDLAGDGLANIGHQKALRFIHKCQQDSPMSKSTASMDELTSWAKAAALVVRNDVCLPVEEQAQQKKSKRCSVCLHPGNKTMHQRRGCPCCGTSPGEPCLPVTKLDRFRKSVRRKALSMRPQFDPKFVLEAYMNPNDNQLPLVLLGQTSQSLAMKRPRLAELLNSDLLVKGFSRTQNAEFIKHTLSRVLVRAELHKAPSSVRVSSKLHLSREQPVPLAITRRLVRNQIKCFEIKWRVEATVTDSHGIGIDGHEFSTWEKEKLVAVKYPKLVEAFQDLEREGQKQGEQEQSRRAEFVAQLLGGAEMETEEGQPKRKKAKKQRHCYFNRQGASHSPPIRLHVPKISQCGPDLNRPTNKRKASKIDHCGPGLNSPVAYPKRKASAMHASVDEEHDLVDDVPDLVNAIETLSPCPAMFRSLQAKQSWEHELESTRSVESPMGTPLGYRSAIFCHMGGMELEITPVASRLSLPVARALFHP